MKMCKFMKRESKRVKKRREGDDRTTIEHRECSEDLVILNKKQKMTMKYDLE